VLRNARLGAALAPFVVIAACNGSSSYLDATGTAGAAEARLGRWLTGVACAVVVLVCIAIGAGIARHRGEDNDPRSGTAEARSLTARNDIHAGLRWIYYGMGATAVVLLAAFAGTMVTLNATSHPPREPSLIMDVTAHQWWWEIRYSQAAQPELTFTTANEVHLPTGVPVRVRLQSADVIHSFWMPQIAGKMDVIPGQTNEMWVEATQAKTTRGMCGEYCGLEHAMMALTVTAESPVAFNAWTRAQRAGAAMPADGEAKFGAKVFAETCGSCHAVNGTESLGRFGPDLTHIASRAMIGAGALTNTASNLSRWIANAPAIKEGARMPAMRVNDRELHAVVAYLQTLQ
jgi:cytochrome c oxidase subunit 2